MRFTTTALVAFHLLLDFTGASPYRADLTDYNLNINQNAQSPMEYQAERPGNKYTGSPTNWRALPVYTVLLDKFADGNPANNDYFKSLFESDWRETQLRYGGDLRGLQARLDYLQGMGVKVIFVSGTPFLNMLWQADSELCVASNQRTPRCHILCRLFAARFYRP
jgi:alpha-1,3-glucan synthase